jgi:ferredoxin
MSSLPMDYDFTEDEERMRAILDETEYDTELGIALAKDAQKLVSGELSEAEFAARHHEAIVEEFETDDRPLDALAEARGELEDEGADERDLVERLKELDPDDEETRREVLKKSGALAGLLSLGAWGTVEGATGDDEEGAASADGDDEGRRMGMVIDLERCDGCLGCVDACREENNWSSGANWMYVLAYEDEGEDFLIRPCQHCSNAPCDKVCPVQARHTREEDGLVLTDYDICIGCRYC